MGRNSPVGLATRYGLDGPGIETRWGEIFRIRPDRPCDPPSLIYNGYRVSLLGGKAVGGVVLTTHPHLAPRLKEEYSYNSTCPLGLRDLFLGEHYSRNQPHCNDGIIPVFVRLRKCPETHGVQNAVTLRKYLQFHCP